MHSAKLKRNIVMMIRTTHTHTKTHNTFFHAYSFKNSYINSLRIELETKKWHKEPKEAPDFSHCSQ